MATSPLAALSQIISTGVQTLEAAYAKQCILYPSLDAPFQPGPLDVDPVLVETAQLIVAAASQLIATVRSPKETIHGYAASMHTTSTLSFVVEADIPDVLEEAGPMGLHVKDIAAATGINTAHQGCDIARILRFLATRHVFNEVAPNMFANNRISSLLVKAKSPAQLKADPKAKYDGAPIAAVVANTGDESLKASGYLSEFLHNPGNIVSPFNAAYNTSASIWEWRAQPQNAWRARRFAVAMKGIGEFFPPGFFAEVIAGDKLPVDALVVDVGGSIGTVTLQLATVFPHLRYIVQDLEKENLEGKKFWASSAPDLLESGRVELQVHNFFEPQPVKDAAIYFMRMIIHDWPDAAAKQIMVNTRKAAGIHSKLVLFDLGMPYVCQTPDAPTPPFPLLPNLGIGGAGFVTALDMQMMTLFNGKERTAHEFKALGEATGWKLEEVKPGITSAFVFSAT